MITLASAQGNLSAQVWLQNNRSSARTKNKFFKASRSYFNARENTAVIMSSVIGVAETRIDLIEEDRLQALVKWIRDHTGRRAIKDKDLSVAAFLIGINALGEEGFRREYHLSTRSRRAGQTFTEAVNGLPVPPAMEDRDVFQGS